MRLFKKYFIPHEINQYKPHLLRNEVAFAILALVLIIEGAFLSQAVLFGRRSGFLALILPNTLVDETNQNRVALNLPVLTEDPLLTAAAQQKANDMAAKSYFAHTSPQGLTPWYWFQQVGYKYAYAGENLAVNFSDSQDVTNAWMNSPDHRANIVNNHYTQIGIATAQGVYEGRSTVFVVQLFGKPATPKPVAVATTKPANPQPAPVAPAPTPVPVTPRPTSTPVPAPISRPAPEPEPLVPPQQNFVAVEGAATATLPATVKPATVSTTKETPTQSISTTVAAPVQSTGGGGEEGMTRQSNLIQRIFSAPRLTANIIYAILAALIVMALFLNIFVKMSVQHPQLVLNGLMILLTIGTLAVFNQHLFLANAKIF